MVSLRSTEPTADPLAIPGPVLVCGAGGFVGAHLLATLSAGRTDVVGLGTRPDPWRLRGLPHLRYEAVDPDGLTASLDRHRPKTIINVAAAGAYPYQSDSYRNPSLNVGMVDELARWAVSHGAAIVHAGSSSEYGTNCAGPDEDAPASPNSLYAVTKLAATHLLADIARREGLRATVLRLYSVYGPLEEPRRLVPEILRRVGRGELPPFAAPDTSRDFVFIDDVVDAFIAAAVAAHAQDQPSFRVYNVASGSATSMADVADAVRAEFGIDQEPVFSAVRRTWDLANWYGDPRRIRSELGWRARTPFRAGLRLTQLWHASDPARAAFLEDAYSAAAPVGDAPGGAGERTRKVSAVIACYKDGQAIPHMHRRLAEVFARCGVDYEIIFVNDASPDDSVEAILDLSRTDPHVIGITHRRNFGSQAAFLSGMKQSTGDAVVLLDGDLQDPPEMIEKFIDLWGQGYEVVYGHRVDREAPWYMRLAYKGFYRLFNRSAPFKVPTDAGDFSLMDRRVVDRLLKFPERDVFLRALRAYVGGRQVGVDYKRPERMFGRSTNNLARNVGWATKGILSVSRVPLSAMATFSFVFVMLSMIGLLAQVATKIIFPDSAPHGTTMLITLIVLLGSVNLLAISVVGVYVGTILEESKRRPRFIRDHMIRSGQILPAADEGHDEVAAPAWPDHLSAGSNGTHPERLVPQPRGTLRPTSVP